MSRNKGHFKGKHGKHNTFVGEKSKELLKNIDENNPTIKLFRTFAKELDDKHDRYERIVKLSRDITIESKRIIFLLHNANVDVESKRKLILCEAELRIKKLVDDNFSHIAVELEEHDPYLYQKAYTNGMQEFIEALVLFQYLSKSTFDSFEKTGKLFVYDIDDRKVNLHFSHYDFILGIADFTGELMRRCINNLGYGNIEECFKICNTVKHINTGFLATHGNKEIGKKIYTLRQSLSKMEIVCYNIQVRGSEFPKHMLVSVLEGDNKPKAEEEDEGFY